MRRNGVFALAAVAVAISCAACHAPAAPRATASASSTAATWRTSASGSPSPATSRTPTTARPLTGVVVGVDAGHDGGNASHPAMINRQVPAGFGTHKECDTVGAASKSGYAEHAHNFDVAMRLKADLERLGARVVLTRTNDTGVGPCVDQRNAIFRAAHVRLAVSIHADGNDSASARGFHVIRGSRAEGGAAVVSASAALAVAVRDAFQSGTGMPRSTYIGRGTGLDVRSDLAACNLALAPIVMLEAGNMRQATDAAALASPTFRQREADAVAAGIVAYLHG